MLSNANAQGLRVSKYVAGANLVPRRRASLTGAIQRGVRKARNIVDRGARHDVRSDLQIKPFRGRATIPRHRNGSHEEHYESLQFPQTRHSGGNFRQSHQSHQNRIGTFGNQRQIDRALTRERDGSSFNRPGDFEQVKREPLNAERHVKVPLSIPRTSAASEFIYGKVAVRAALHSGIRKLYTLYINEGAINLEEREGDRHFTNLAQKRGVYIKRVGDDGLGLLDKMAQGRPHNGYVLEASQLPNAPAMALERVARPGEGFSFKIAYQTAEDLAINGVSNKITVSSRRYPFVLMLDSILDPGNLGGIIRSAAFFGVDAVALVDFNLAPLSPVAVKASAGAAECMHFLKIKNDHDFVTSSQSNGWKFFGAVAPQSVSAKRGGNSVVSPKDVEDALMKGPCVLMIGGEGYGLRPRMQKAVDGVVGIEGALSRNPVFGLDSLNVSVAAGLIIQSFLKGSNGYSDLYAPAPEPKASTNDEKLF